MNRVGGRIPVTATMNSVAARAASLAASYHQRELALSLSDAFAFALARTAGLAALRGLAKIEGVQCHGVLWLLDLMNDEGAGTRHALHDGLPEISRMGRPGTW